MARKEYQGKAVHTDSQFPCRYLYGIRRTDTESHHTLDTEFPDGQFQCDGGQLPLSGLSGSGYLPDRTVCPLRGEGRHQSWGYQILYAISRRQGRIKRHNTWSSIIASSITIGFGGSVGAEAPIVLTGSAIGSNLGTIFKMEHRTLMLLVGCGAAGAVAGIFKAPIAGLVFTLEVLMIDLTMSSLLPLLISAVTAATVSYIVTGTDAMFKFHLDQAFELERIPYVIMLGIFCGLVSLYFTRAMNSVEGVFGRLRTPYKKLIMGGAMLSILIFLFLRCMAKVTIR